MNKSLIIQGIIFLTIIWSWTGYCPQCECICIFSLLEHASETEYRLSLMSNIPNYSFFLFVIPFFHSLFICKFYYFKEVLKQHMVPSLRVDMTLAPYWHSITLYWWFVVTATVQSLSQTWQWYQYCGQTVWAFRHCTSQTAVSAGSTNQDSCSL